MKFSWARRASWASVIVVALVRPFPAAAGPRDIRVLPVAVQPSAAAAPVDLGPMRVGLAQVLSEAVKDFGLQPLPPLPDEQLPDRQRPASGDADLAELEHDSWVLEPELGLSGSELSLRLTVVPPGSRVLLVRMERVTPSELEVKSLSMLRELLQAPASGAAAECLPPEGAGAPVEVSRRAAPPASEGRAVLALHTAALGGYVGYSLQRASGSNDARLTYPLAALGAGIGVGAAMIVSDEWDIDVGRAWFLGAGMLWPTVSTLLILDTDDGDTPGSRQMLGLAGAIGGVTLATAGLVLGDVTEGGAALTHSGAGLGLLVGGLVEMTIEGDAEATPRRGVGWGALTGVLLAGAAATQIEAPSATDMLFVDLSALLGGLAGAAVGTPVLVSQDPSPLRDRIWLSGILAGTLGGAGLSYWLAQTNSAPRDSRSAAPGLTLAPQLGWMGRPLGLGLSGQW